MKKILLILAVLFSSISLSNAIELSERSRVSILTHLPGTDLYSVFGHIEIRLSDPVNNFDAVYSYGMFDFDTPFFYAKFVRGNLMYQVDRKESWDVFRRIPYYNRTAYEQVLNLSHEEIQKLYQLLEENLLPENKYYQYDFLYDNCATRVRDMVVNATNRNLHFPHDEYLDKTFRDLLFEKTNHSFLFDFGINILMGTNSDKKAAPLEYMFLPEYIMEIYGKTEISDDSTSVQFSSTPALLYETTRETTSDGKKLAIKISWFVALIILGITILEFINKKYFRFVDISLFSISGLLGILFVFLWVGSLHKIFENNLNAFWMLPTNMWIAILLIRKKKSAWTKWHALLGILFILILLIGWNILPQKFSLTFIPFMLILLIRHYSYLRNYLKVALPFKK